MAEYFPSLAVANDVAETASKAQSLTVCVYQIGAQNFAVAYDNEPVFRGLLIGQYKNGQPTAPVEA